MNTIKPAFPTYPARPIAGGPYPKARTKTGNWVYEPKYNGWRALVHIPTGTMFNRHGAQLSIAREFSPALDALRTTVLGAATEWADVEALERRHGIGQGCLIVLDAIPNPDLAQTPYTQRKDWLLEILPVLDCFVPFNGRWSFNSIPPGFPLLSTPPRVAPGIAWNELQSANRHLRCPFYEGLVGKLCDSPYPLQLRLPTEEFPCWVKHRWAF